MSRGCRCLGILLVASVVAGCAGTGGPLLANPTLAVPAPAPTAPAPRAVADPIPIVLPRDDGPHDRLTEWWYYTGHLVDATGRHWGFEFVIFRAERGDFPVSWASHLALTDESGGRFLYSQRAEIGSQVDRSPRGADGSPTGFRFAINGTVGLPGATGAGSKGTTPWTMSGSAGHDVIDAVFPPGAATGGASGGTSAGPSSADGQPAIHLTLDATKPPALHGAEGWLNFGPAGGSYYYSRTRMAASGTLTIGGSTMGASGIAWFDHQWGDFIAIGGGWDWFAVNLADGTDLTLSLVRNADGSRALAYGTLVGSDGLATQLDSGAFEVTVRDRWRSPATGADYPAGWRLTVRSVGLVIDLLPTVADQELDTRETTGVVYWEGSQVVSAVRDGRAVGGSAYVELTGYAPASAAGKVAP